MIVTAISDLHGYQPRLPGGDLLIIAGDLTSNDKLSQHQQFREWIHSQNYRYTVYIAGNHDHGLLDYVQKGMPGVRYLCDSGTEFEGFRIWGSPWSPLFYGQNPLASAFSVTESELIDKFALIPDDTDILVTHTPPWGILDYCSNGRVGSGALLRRVKDVKPALHVFGHIHEGAGRVLVDDTLFVNASHVNGRYKPVNPPIQLTLQKDKEPNC